MKKLTVSLNKSYDIIIGSGLLNSCGEYIKKVTKAKKAFVVSDSNVSKIYLEKVKKSLGASGFDVSDYVFSAGEQNKTFSTVNNIVNEMAKAHLTRSDIAVALGGGVCGDMTGFASAIYMRGIDFIQLSTSLLSDIDSSVGGKTGCDLESGKNLIGAFHQPSLVLIDTDALSTLPTRYFNDGMGEAVKASLIRSDALFKRLKNENASDFIEDLIYDCVDIKRVIVENDEFESGERKLLNFGHTLGHAIEKYYNFERYSHGEAISIGMVMITRAAEKNGLARVGLADDIIGVLNKFNLPSECDADIGKLVEICLLDKKCKADSIDLIISEEIGKSKIVNVKTDSLLNFFGGI